MKTWGPSVFQRLFLSFLSVGLFIVITSGTIQYLSKKEFIETSVRSRISHDLDGAIAYFHNSYTSHIENHLAFIEASALMNDYMKSEQQKILIRPSVEKLFLHFTNSVDSIHLSLRFIDFNGREKIITSGNKRIKDFTSVEDYPDEILYHKIYDIHRGLEYEKQGTIIFKGPFKYRDKYTFVVGMTKSEPEVGGSGGTLIFHCDLQKYLDYLGKLIYHDLPVAQVTSGDRSLVLSTLPGNEAEEPSATVAAGKNLFVLSKPVNIGSYQEPLLHIKFNVTSDIVAGERREAFKISIITGLIIILLAGFLAFIISKQFTRPIVHLARAADKLAVGNLETRVHVDATGEIQTLVDSFNKMGDDLQNTTVSKDYFNDILKNMLDSLIVINPDGTIKTVNRATCNLLGYQEEELVGRNFNQVIVDNARIGGENMPFRGETFQSLFNEGVVVNTKITYRTKGGFKIPMLLSGSVMKDKNGKLQSVVAIARDFTEIQLAEDAMQSARLAAEIASQTKSDFLANMSHEIRTPLNGILGMTHLLANSDLNLEQNSYVKMARSSGEHLQGLINNILDFSKIEAGKLELENISFDLRLTLEDAAEVLAIQTMEKNLELINKIDSNVPNQLFGDPGRLRQIVINLAGNAEKFTSSGHIYIHTQLVSETGKSVLLKISVKDTGTGISDDKQSEIFNSFSQADSSTTRRYGGTGLGLTISKLLTEAMGGSIGVMSKENKGSNFWFTAKFVKEKSPAPALPREFKKLRVLVTDPNEITRIYLVDLLEEWGCRPAPAQDTATALTFLKSARSDGDPYRIILIEKKILDDDNNSLVKKIKKDASLKKIRMIYMTSGPHLDDNKRVQNLGFEGYIPKPIRERDLLECMHVLLTDSKTPLTNNYYNKDLLVRMATANKPRSSLNILLVEDNEISRKLALTLLNKMEFRVEYAANGKEALTLCKKSKYDLILMDCQMPVMDGYTTTGEIRRMHSRRKNITKPTVPIVAMTANAMEGDREKCLAAGMDDYISKPIEFKQVVRILDKWLKQKPETAVGQYST